LRATDASKRLEEDILSPLTRTSRGWYVWVGFLGLTVALGLAAWSYQLKNGLITTGMRDQVMWGLYITNFVFFIGISHAGTLISAILRVTHAEWRRPVTRMAEVITVVALMMGALMPIFDLGRPDRLPNLILHGRLGSPIIWDLISITTYLTGSLIYLYLPLIPDIALARDRLKAMAFQRRPYRQPTLLETLSHALALYLPLIPDIALAWDRLKETASRLRWRLYDILSMGWRDTPEQRRRLERGISIMMILIIPIAVSVHTVVSWIFAMTLRAGWNSTIFGPYFVVGAIFSGIAAIITVMAIFRKVYHLEAYITEKQFRYLGYMLLALGLIYMYFTLAEYLTTGYKLEEADKPLLEALMLGKYAPPFWTFAIGGTVLPVLLVALPWTRTVKGIVLASVLVNVGMWLKRFVIVIPSLGRPLMPYEWGVYWPTWVELSITAGAFAGFALIFTLFAKLFPIVSVWEVKEGWEREAARAAAPALVPGGIAVSPATANPGGLKGEGDIL